MARRRADELDGLYAVRPQEFTQARRALVQRLKEAGKPAEAREAERRRRPSVALWVVNQLARRDPDAVREFVDAAQTTMRAQRTGRSELAVSTARQHEAMQRLSHQAKALLAELGRAVSPELGRRMSWTLLGAAVDPHTRARLRQGTLDVEHSAPDLAALGTTRAAAASTGRGTPSRASSRRRAAVRARRARSTAKRLAREAARQGRAVETSARAVNAMRERLQRAEAALARRQAQAERAREQAERARDEAEKGRTAA
jgi:hypothetical protein